jgi:hypothetical protein
MWSVVDRNVVMRRVPVCIKFVEPGGVTFHLYDWKDTGYSSDTQFKNFLWCPVSKEFYPVTGHEGPDRSGLIALLFL